MQLKWLAHKVVATVLISVMLSTGLGLWYAGTGAASSLVTVRGRLTVMRGTGSNGYDATLDSYVLTADDGRTIRLFFSNDVAVPAGGVSTLDGYRVNVTGAWTEPYLRGAGSPALHVNAIRSAAGADTQSVSMPVEEALGPHPWIVILCKFADDGSEPKSPAYFRSMYDNSKPGLDHYYRELSYGRMNVAGSRIAGWYALPHPKSHYVYDMDGDGDEDTDYDRLAQDCTSVAEPNVHFPDYYGINLMFNGEWPGYYGLSSTRTLTLDGMTKKWEVTWMDRKGDYNMGLTAHEIDHGLGISGHSYGYTDDGTILGATPWDAISVTCYYAEYDPTYNCIPIHLVAPHKLALGWIFPEETFVATPGQHTVTLERLAQPQTSNPLVAKIPVKGSTTHYYTVEARHKAGYDDTPNMPGDAVIIYEVNPDVFTEGPRIIPTDYDHEDPGGTGAMWLPGMTFSDDENGISVRVESKTATGFIITVEMAPYESDFSGSNTTASPVRPSAGEQVVFMTEIVNAGATASNVVVDATIPSNTAYVPGSASTTQGSVSGSGPLTFTLGDVPANAPVTLTFAVTVDNDVTTPTALSSIQEITWTGGSHTLKSQIVANGVPMYLPTIIN